MTRVVVVGAGIAGLTAAYLAKKRGMDVTVLEASNRAGGVVHSTWNDGMLCEWGAQAVLDNAPDTQSLIESLGLSKAVVRSNDEARRRFILRRGRFHELPMKPQRFLLSRLLSTRGKLRALRERSVPPVKPGVVETLHDFGVRRVGPEATEVLIDAMAAGVFAGDPRRMELDACFPKVRAMELAHGSLLKAMMKQGRPAKPSVLQSFGEGMKTLVDGLVKALGPSLRLSTPVKRVEKSGDAWRLVTTESGTVECDRVIVAVPSNHAAGMLAGTVRDDGIRALETIPYAPVDVLCHSVRVDDAPPHLLDLAKSFGFLIPTTDGNELGTEILGVLFTRGAFPNHGPHNAICMRTLVGGMRNPGITAFSDEEVTARITEQLTQLLGLERAPRLHTVIRWPRAIAQYELGHSAKMRVIDAAVAERKGLHLVGAAYRGPGVNDCIREAARVVEAL